jgi:hypothetical protein
LRQTIACNIKSLAENILNPHIASKAHKDLPCQVEAILASLRPEINAVANDDPNKFQLLNAYLRDKISEGMQ